MRISSLIRVLLGSVLVLGGSVDAKGQPNVSRSNAATSARASGRVSPEVVRKSIESFQEFKKLATHGDNGVYVVGDIAFANDAELRKYWEKTAVHFYGTKEVYIVGDTAIAPPKWGATSSSTKAGRVGNHRSFSRIEDALKYSQQKLIGNQPNDAISNANRPSISINIVDGAPDIWDAAKRLDLRYCVSDAFAENKGNVVTWVQAAAVAWETLGKVKFIYVPAEDRNATSANNNVTFDVRPASEDEERNNRYHIVARTFFPSSERAAREFVIYKSFLKMDSGYLFKHELGHALGFRHEHIWFGDWTGETPDGAMPLGPRDTASIMYYFFLPGYSGNKDFSAGDRAGALKVYPR